MKSKVRLIHYYNVKSQPSTFVSMRNNTFIFGIYLYSVGTHHRNLLKSLVAMRKVTYFIPAGPKSRAKIQKKTKANGPGTQIVG